ncbi:hypothetical protein [Methylacidimicrobium tartarophylax]|uniref:Uncharacterized protein n=1 Tax=Methylacidimicrobium tartarophylax TaxID=1041768 RepID=A0A5E6MAM4_9BACT|nr:hypothetical protein [Methylacidimicrobium tartarophylax]VVM06019.1 hypothetical protein MAMT_00914 [Methylacidimicrobium tartarophylax]
MSNWCIDKGRLAEQRPGRRDWTSAAAGVRLVLGVCAALLFLLPDSSFAHRHRPKGPIDCGVVSQEGYTAHLDICKYEPMKMYESYCENVPKTGEATLVLDLMSHPLWKTPVALTLFREQGKEVVADAPPHVYREGIASLRVHFATPGRYTLEVKPQGVLNAASQPVVLKFPISVGMPSPKSFASLGVGEFVAVAILGFLLYRFWRKRQFERLKKSRPF